MDSLQSLQSDRRHKDDIVPPARSAAPVTARLGWGSADPESPQQVDVAAEETCPAPAAQMSGEESHLAPPIQPPPGPSEKTLELINQLDALAGDLAASGHSSSDQFVEKVHDEPNFSGEARVVEPSIRVSPRPNFEKDPFASDRPLIARRTIFTLVGCCAAALIGVALASQSHRVWTTNASSELQAAAPQERPSLVGQTSASIAAPPSAPVAQTASAVPASSPELGKQLETMAQDLAVVRRSLEQLSAKQEQLAAAQQQLEQLASKQEQLAGKQEQMAQSIAKLQAPEQNVRRRMSPPPQARQAPLSSRVSPEPTAQVSSAPRPAPSHPVPPLPIPDR